MDALTTTFIAGKAIYECSLLLKMKYISTFLEIMTRMDHWIPDILSIKQTLAFHSCPFCKLNNLFS